VDRPTVQRVERDVAFSVSDFPRTLQRSIAESQR